MGAEFSNPYDRFPEAVWSRKLTDFHRVIVTLIDETAKPLIL